MAIISIGQLIGHYEAGMFLTLLIDFTRMHAGQELITGVSLHSDQQVIRSILVNSKLRV